MICKSVRFVESNIVHGLAKNKTKKSLKFISAYLGRVIYSEEKV